MRHIALLALSTLALTACEPDAGNAREPEATGVEAPVPPPPPENGPIKDAPPVTIIEHNEPAPANPDAPELLVDGKPADPLCFAPYLMREDALKTLSLDTANCAPSMTATHKDFTPIEGYTGTGYYWNEDPEAQGMRPAFIAYKVLGETAKGLALELLGSGGGTGVFSTLITAKRDGNTLTVTDTVTGGDRCNGGLSDAAVSDGKLTYAVNITPYDFLTLGIETPPEGLEAYDDIDACAACCMGEALYEDGAFIGVQLPEKFVATERPAEQTKQICFDRIMSEQTTTSWSAAEYAPLRDRLRKECASE